MVSMAEEVTQDTSTIPEGMFDLTLAGRTIRFREVSQGQTTILRRYLVRLQTELDTADPQRQREIYDLIQKAPLDIIETRFTDIADRDWVEQQLMLGVLDVKELMRVFANGAAIDEPPADDADPAPKRKRAAKKVANASRARR